MNALTRHLNQVATLLEPSDISKVLREKGAIHQDSSNYIEALDWIIQISTAPRGLEDIFVPSISHNDWFQLLSSLTAAAKSERENYTRSKLHRIEN
jgi:hypothetical protein